VVVGTLFYAEFLTIMPTSAVERALEVALTAFHYPAGLVPVPRKGLYEYGVSYTPGLP